jgi:hypothetical protein
VDDRRFHFGLGRVAAVDRLTLVRAGGRRLELRGAPVDRRLVFPADTAP